VPFKRQAELQLFGIVIIDLPGGIKDLSPFLWEIRFRVKLLTGAVVAAGRGQIDAISGMWVQRVSSDRRRSGVIEPPDGSCLEIITPWADKRTRDARRVPRPVKLRPARAGK